MRDLLGRLPIIGRRFRRRSLAAALTADARVYAEIAESLAAFARAHRAAMLSVDDVVAAFRRPPADT